MDANGLLGDVPERVAPAGKKSPPPAPSSEKATAAESLPAVASSSGAESSEGAPGDSVLAAESGDVAVRVLVKCEFGHPNDIVVLDARAVQVAKGAGKVCDHENSIAAARALSRK
ncbi:hypothetical protein GIY62_06160 [Burkholderia plantarii]|uniref:hypothetical protein n=1 Tax=Burkholderia plantarii TaxID=41899 RepID=UPI00272C4314|nr:hypothetical protein [Burkholderia plantarii]WLE60241.1 hypothetical protein GIY62_06160 [Burkholderia plantarii]